MPPSIVKGPISELRSYSQEASKGVSDVHNDLEIDTTSQYPKWKTLVLVLLATCLTVFIVTLDTTIVTTALPRIIDDFHSLDDAAW